MPIVDHFIFTSHELLLYMYSDHFKFAYHDMQCDVWNTDLLLQRKIELHS